MINTERIIKEIHTSLVNNTESFDDIGIFCNEYKWQIKTMEKSVLVIIFGAGGYGRWLLDDLRQYTNVNVCCFCDNNMDITGMYIDGVKVMTVEMAIDSNIGAVFAVTPKLHQMEIKDQLMQLGVPEDQILLLDMEKRWA